MSETVKPWQRQAPKLAAGAFILLVMTGMALLVHHMLNSTGEEKKPVIQQIMLVRPPPPPPPKVEEKPPPPKEEVKIPEPKPMESPKPDNAPPAKNLGLDTKGGPGSDNFGLVGNKGGQDIIGGAGSGSRFGWYSTVVQQGIYAALQKEKALRESSYRVVVKLWLDKTGHVERVELGGSTGSAQLDDALKVALQRMKPLSEAPPEDLPQPVQIRVTSRQD